MDEVGIDGCIDGCRVDAHLQHRHHEGDFAVPRLACVFRICNFLARILLVELFYALDFVLHVGKHRLATRLHLFIIVNEVGLHIQFK